MTRATTTTVLALLGTLTMAIPAVAQQNQPSFAYINSRQIIEQAPGAQEARDSMENEVAGYEAELEQLGSEIQTMINEFQQSQGMMSAEARQQRQSEIAALQQEYQMRANELRQQALQREQELVQPIMDRIDAVISELRDERGYTMIFDSSAGALIAADPSLDITDEVLRRLNEASTALNPQQQ